MAIGILNKRLQRPVGPTGRGVCELQGVLSEIDFLFGSFSKSFGGIGGGWIAGRSVHGVLRDQGLTATGPSPGACGESK